MIEGDKREAEKRLVEVRAPHKPSTQLDLATFPRRNSPEQSVTSHPNPNSAPVDQSERGMRRFCGFIDAGVWLARSAAFGLGTAVAGVVSFGLLSNGSYLFGTLGTLATAGAAWLTYRLVKLAWQAAKGEGRGII